MSTPPATSIASNAIAAQEPALASSFRFHRARGPMCARGYCSQCEIETAQGRKLACQTRHDGAGGLRRRRDPLRPLGQVARLFTPWFWEHRFLRPRALRRRMLHLLRYLSSAGPLAPVARPWGIRTFEECAVDAVFVGPAGAAEPGAYAIDPDGGDIVLGVYPDRTLGVLRAGRMLSLRFQRLVLETGTYERLPPIPGNDLPGVVGLEAAEIYGRAGALRHGLRIALWAPPEDQARGRALATRHGIEVVWSGDVAPRRIVGRSKVRAIELERGRVACDLFVVGVRQPAIELALQAGATASLTAGELPILAIDSTPDWLEVRGTAGLRSSGVPDVRPTRETIACACEDVRVKDLQACVAQGLEQPELVKRRTGAMTGPCQGKLCAAAVLATLRDCGADPTPTRSRPLVRPVTLGELAADA